MILKRLLLVPSLTLALAGVASAQESAGFIVMLGRDTTGVEQFTRTATSVDVHQVGRSPRVLQRHTLYAMDTAGGMQRLGFTVTNPLDPASAPPMQKFDATFTPDSMLAEIHSGKQVRQLHVAMPPGTVPLSGSPWEMFETLSMRLFADRADSLTRTGYYLGADTISYVAVRRIGPDSVEIQTLYDRYHAQVDLAGKLLHVVPIKGTAQFTVERVASVDVAAYTASFLAQQQKSGVMGALSPRDTVTASAGGATLWVDYGRPSRRGRTIFGGVVPWGDVWRTGANAATQFKTDRALDMNGTTVPAGFYTLWSIPQSSGWKLLINGETGQWGTEHKPERDLYTIEMPVSALPDPVEQFTIAIVTSPTGGAIHFDWDTTRATLPFTVKK